MPVYFIQAENGPIKIGVAGDPVKRLRDLQVGNAYPLTLLRVLPGSFREEYKIHVLFGDARMSGEWFEPIDDLLGFIASGGEHTVELEHRWLRMVGKEVPGEYESTEEMPICRQCGINLRATEPDVGEVILSDFKFPDMCGACREFAALREAGEDPFSEVA